MRNCLLGWNLHAAGLLRFLSIAAVRASLRSLRHVCPLVDGDRLSGSHCSVVALYTAENDVEAHLFGHLHGACS